MADLTDKELAAMRPNMRLDRASESILRRHLVALLDEVERHRIEKAAYAARVRHAAELAADRLATPAVQRSAADVHAVPVARLEMPKRKRWDAGRCDRGDTCEEGGYESSDYIDGWNDALDAVAEKIQ